MVSFAVQKLWSLIQPCLFLLSFLLLEKTHHRKYTSTIRVKECFCLCSLLGALWLQVLHLGHLICFEFIFLYGMKKCSNLPVLHGAIQFSQHHLLKILCFPYCSFLPPLSYINWPWVYGFISRPSILFYWSMSFWGPAPCCFDYCSFMV